MTWQLIETFALKNKTFKGLKLSRNKGHQYALLAGLHTAEGDAVVSIDADLQDDVNAITQKLLNFKTGDDVVYGVRNKRTSDSFLKRFTAESYYNLLGKMGVDRCPPPPKPVPPGPAHSDNRVEGRRLVGDISFRRGDTFVAGCSSPTRSDRREEVIHCAS